MRSHGIAFVLLAAAISMAVTGCAHATRATTTPSAEPSPAATPTPSTYSVLDAGKPGTPKLSRLQLAWLQLIHDDPKYRPVWKSLYWSPEPDEHLPLIVYEADGGQEHLIIGDVCNAAFDDSENTLMTLSHFDTPCKPSEQVPVRGQKALTGWEP